MREIRNARITNARIFIEDHGILTYFLDLDYGGSGQGFGGYDCRGKWLGLHIEALLNLFHAESWHDLIGLPVRVDADYGKIHQIGHYLNDEWFNPELLWEHHKEKEDG